MTRSGHSSKKSFYVKRVKPENLSGIFKKHLTCPIKLFVVILGKRRYQFQVTSDARGSSITALVTNTTQLFASLQIQIKMVVLKSSSAAISMAARTLIIRPQMTSLCAFRPRLLSSLAFSSSSPLKSSSPELTIRRNHQSITTVSRRSFCIRATTQVNDPGSIDSPLMQSMKQKVKQKSRIRDGVF